MKQLLIAELCAFLFGLGVGYTVNDWKRDASDAERVQQEAKKKDEQRNTAHVASKEFEAKRTVNEVQYRTVTVTLKEYVDRPVYFNQCLDDDGLRILNEQILGHRHSTQSGNTMP